MSRFQGPGEDGSKWQTLSPQFNNNTLIEFKMNLKEILEMEMEKNVNNKSIDNDFIAKIEENILRIYKMSVNVHKYCIKSCFIITFICFIGMIGYPFGNLFGLIIPSKDNTRMIIIYAILLVVIEIIFIYFYFKCHDIAHHLEHKAICLFIDNLKEWINNYESDKKINLIYPEQILDYDLIDHGKPLNIYICVTEWNQLFQHMDNMFVVHSLKHRLLVNNTNHTVQTPLLKS